MMHAPQRQAMVDPATSIINGSCFWDQAQTGAAMSSLQPHLRGARQASGCPQSFEPMASSRMQFKGDGGGELPKMQPVPLHNGLHNSQVGAVNVAEQPELGPCMLGNDAFQDAFTTLIIRNIPARCSQDQLLELWPQEGSYNFLHCPYNRKHGRLAGYAFVNFITHEALLEFYERWQGMHLIKEANAKRLNIAVALVQGMEANLMHLKDNKNIKSTRKEHLPVIFLPDGSMIDFLSIMK